MQLIMGAIVGIFSLGIANYGMNSLYEDRWVAVGKLDHIGLLLNVNQLIISKTIAGNLDEVGPKRMK
ncbi:hypothetical protein ACFQAT_18540 [Undibacterium arcticum]|uniref:hypothetical protein n=1 Tax=Undibacterium arcticum TaxID=1762892 RepID=UPI00360B4795